MNEPPIFDYENENSHSYLEPIENKKKSSTEVKASIYDRRMTRPFHSAHDGMACSPHSLHFRFIKKNICVWKIYFNEKRR